MPVALVTGGRRGIGRGITLALAERGFDVVVADLEEDADARRTLDGVELLGRKAAFLAADIADIERRHALAEKAFAAFGTVDCLVNNAGVQVAVRGDLLEVTPESFDRVWASTCAARSSSPRRWRSGWSARRAAPPIRHARS